jgi:hypothetical protein
MNELGLFDMRTARIVFDMVDAEGNKHVLLESAFGGLGWAYNFQPTNLIFLKTDLERFMMDVNCPASVYKLYARLMRSPFKTEADYPKLRTIISGGQTGADRGGLDAALECGGEEGVFNTGYPLTIGGALPKGRIAEDGKVPDKYTGMYEVGSSSYPQRTRENIEKSDATVIFRNYKRGKEEGKLSRGTALTVKTCEAKGKPYLLIPVDVDVDSKTERDFIAVQWVVESILEFLCEHNPTVLNIAGPRESSNPGMQARVRQVMLHVLVQWLTDELPDWVLQDAVKRSKRLLSTVLEGE